MPGKLKLINWQRPIRHVLIALIPVALSSLYFFGWRVLWMMAAVNAAGFLAEYVFTRRWKQPVSSAVFVTNVLFCLSLPPALPVWMAVVGIVFAVVFGKMVFGGFGRNVFNPALAGRAFIYVCFGAHMTGQWREPVGGILGGLAAYSSDAVTQATPGMALKAGGAVPLPALLLGNTAGVVGGTSALLVLLGGLYIVWRKAASYRIVVAGFAGYLAAQCVLWLSGAGLAADPLRGVLAGSVMLGIFFYATDPVSASQTNEGRWIYGAFVGIMTAVISAFSAWPAGTMFAILLANTFAPIMDHGIRELKQWRAAAAKTGNGG